MISMKQKIVPAAEEWIYVFIEIPQLIAFCIFSFVCCFSIKKDKYILLSIVFIFICLWSITRAVIRIMQAQKQRKQCLETCTSKRGTIVGCEMKTGVSHFSNRHITSQPAYVLKIKIIDALSKEEQIVDSVPYFCPVYSLIASPFVQIYQTKEENVYYVEQMQYKQQREESDIVHVSEEEEQTFKKRKRSIFITYAITYIGLFILLCYAAYAL